ncbi:hypothetical protein [Streptomyces formicae]|uniref:Uncharacterized protein n=1 Tax=Streptomyces formicae TaxID=1616117 RepID=A0ABY3WKH9_9ACTN|nr:hypothetical protein [Streptomyces formicae]UNM12195.1 hypothetical protein J4032_12195 [Streptomyces formicae]
MTITPGDRPKKRGTGNHGRAAYVCRKYGCFRIGKAEVDRVLIGDLEPTDPETGEPQPPELGVILAYLSAPHRHARLLRSATDTSEKQGRCKGRTSQAQG